MPFFHKSDDPHPAECSLGQGNENIGFSQFLSIFWHFFQKETFLQNFQTFVTNARISRFFSKLDINQKRMKKKNFWSLNISLPDSIEGSKKLCRKSHDWAPLSSYLSSHPPLPGLDDRVICKLPVTEFASIFASLFYKCPAGFSCRFYSHLHIAGI